MQDLPNEPNANTNNANFIGQNVKSVDLSAPGMTKLIASRVMAAIDAYCEKAYDDGHRKHLGGSLIGDPCKRKLWYGFRWVLHIKHGGRKLRLFNRGHREEERYIEWLEGIGCKVYYEDRSGLMYHPESDSYFISDGSEEEARDPDFCISHPITETTPDYKQHIANAKHRGIKFKQYRISAVRGHFGGSLDAIILFPPEWGIDEAVLGEFKTNGTGSAFDKIGTNGMAVAKPLHFAQTSTYGGHENYRFRYCLYMCINKNDDSMHVELVKLDWNLGDNMTAKAEQVISSQTPPPKLSESPTFQDCRYCDFNKVCHEGQAAEVNCRSCVYAHPIDGGMWACHLPAHIDNGPIPDEVIAVGCPAHKDITAA